MERVTMDPEAMLATLRRNYEAMVGALSRRLADGCGGEWDEDRWGVRCAAPGDGEDHA